MTNKQLCDFLITRAEAKGKEHGICHPTLVIYNHGNNLYLAFKFDMISMPLFLQFSQNGMRAVFKIVPAYPTVAAFRENIFKLMSSRNVRDIPYNDVDVPFAVKNKISATLVQAFRIKGMGLSMCNPFYGIIDIVTPTETYEEIAIENDLNSFLSCDLAAL